MGSVYNNFIPCTSQTGILWETREVDNLKLSHQIELSVFFYQIIVLDFKRYLQAAGFMLNSSSFFSSMLTIAWKTACTVVLMIMFWSIHVHVSKNVTMALNKVNCSLWVKVPFLLSAQSLDLKIICKMTSLRVSSIIGFSDRETFPGC